MGLLEATSTKSRYRLINKIIKNVEITLETLPKCRRDSAELRNYLFVYAFKPSDQGGGRGPTLRRLCRGPRATSARTPWLIVSVAKIGKAPPHNFVDHLKRCRDCRRLDNLRGTETSIAQSRPTYAWQQAGREAALPPLAAAFPGADTASMVTFALTPHREFFFQLCAWPDPGPRD
jgi:hypothetical protein